MVVYLIHFDRPYKGAQHYIGATCNFNKRMKRHKEGRGAKLLKKLKEEKINWKVVKIWEGQGFEFEKKLKKQKKAKRICPICNPNYGGMYK